MLNVDYSPSCKTSSQPSYPSKLFLQNTRLFFHHGSTRVPKNSPVLSRSNMLFLLSQVPVNQSPIGPISLANSNEDSPSSEVTSQSTQEQSFPRRRGDTIFMSPMLALGVRTISMRGCVTSAFAEPEYSSPYAHCSSLEGS